jgi:hypothetical protein
VYSICGSVNLPSVCKALVKNLVHDCDVLHGRLDEELIVNVRYFVFWLMVYRT